MRTQIQMQMLKRIAKENVKQANNKLRQQARQPDSQSLGEREGESVFDLRTLLVTVGRQLKSTRIRHV